MLTKLRTALLALVCVWAGQVAAVTATAEIRGLTFTLTDLDPNDGITPSYSFGGPLTYTHVSASDMALEWAGGPASSGGGEEFFVYPPVPDIMKTEAHGKTEGRLFVDEKTMAASSISTSDWGSANSIASLYRDDGAIDINLTKQTRLTISGELLASISGKAGCGTSPFGDACSLAIASASIATTGGQTHSVKLRSEPGRSFAESLIAPFSIVVERGTGDYDIEQINMHVITLATSVPEPGTLALWGAGLAVLIAVRRRQLKAVGQ